MTEKKTDVLIRYHRVPLWIAVVGALLIPAVAVGSRLGWWHYTTAFTTFKIDFFVLLLVLFSSLICLILANKKNKQKRFFALALVVSIIPVSMLAHQVIKAKTLPFIHDISTDTIDPPIFVEISKLRSTLDNTLHYEGDSLASQQNEGYPDISTIVSNLSVEDVSNQILQIIKSKHWQLIYVSEDKTNIEAIATSFLFGFKDDIVFRIRPQPKGSLIDIRSASRTGRSDLGVNANRIRQLSDLLNAPQ